MNPQKENALFEQGALYCTFKSNHKPPSQKIQPLRGIVGYEKLRAEWISANPDHGELDLLIACTRFARDCGLVVREQALAVTMQELGGDHARA